MAEPWPYLGNDEIQLILDSLQLDDAVEVVWRQRETRDYNASAIYTWVGTLLFEPDNESMPKTLRHQKSPTFSGPQPQAMVTSTTSGRVPACLSKALSTSLSKNCVKRRVSGCKSLKHRNNNNNNNNNNKTDKDNSYNTKMHSHSRNLSNRSHTLHNLSHQRNLTLKSSRKNGKTLDSRSKPFSRLQRQISTTSGSQPRLKRRSC